MAAPSQTQIQAAVAKPVFTVEVKRAGSWVDVSADVVSVETSLESAGGPNGLAFGAYAAPRATVTLAWAQIGEDWELCPIRVSYGFDTSDLGGQFVGIILDAESDDTTIRYACEGYKAIIERVAIYSPLLFRRPIATATGAATVEDPTDGSWAGGIINYIFWQAGGRPYDQLVSYPSADWYYACDQAIIAPDWTWVGGENAYDELQRACRAAGGQIYQDADGVVRYVEPLKLADGSTGHVFTDSGTTASSRVSGNLGGYGGIGVRSSARDAVSGVECRFTLRRPLGVQRVYQDKTPKLIAAGATATYTLDTQQPLYSVDRCEVSAARLTGGYALTEAEAVVSVTVERAVRTTVTVANTLTVPITVYEISLYANPLGAIEEGSASYTGSTARPFATVRQVEDNPLIQSPTHAARLCRMLYDFLNAAATTVNLSDVGFDPDRTVGETVGLTSAAHSYSSLKCRIVAIRETNGETMTVDLCPVAGLPTRSGCFLIGTSYSGSDTRELSY